MSSKQSFKVLQVREIFDEKLTAFGHPPECEKEFAMGFLAPASPQSFASFEIPA